MLNLHRWLYKEGNAPCVCAGGVKNDTDVWRSETATDIMFAFDVHDWRGMCGE